MDNCPVEPKSDVARCTKTKSVPLSDRPKVQCDYEAGHNGKHQAKVCDKNQDKVIEWT